MRSRDLFLLATTIFLVALGARLAFLWWRGPINAPDSISYMRLARNLLNHGAFSFEVDPPYTPTIRRPPLYPAFLAGLGWCGLISPWAVAASQVVLDAFVAVWIFIL